MSIVTPLRLDIPADLKAIQKKNKVVENWAKTYRCKPLAYFEVETVEQIKAVLDLARRDGRTVKVVGSSHSPSDLVMTNDYIINMDKMNAMLHVDKSTNVVSVQAGIRLYQLHKELASVGLAMSNLGSISDQSIAGAISTATHGTGITFVGLSSMITDMDLVTASGELIACSPTQFSDIFYSACCSLGALGVITRVSLQCEPSFRLHERQEPALFSNILQGLDTVVNSAQHVRIWYYPHTDNAVIWRANRTYVPPKPSSNWVQSTLIGYHIEQALLYVSRFKPSMTPRITDFIYKNVVGTPRESIDESYKSFNFDCLFPQYVNEWAVPIENAKNCLEALRTWIDGTTKAIYPPGKNNNPHAYVHFPIEIRFSDKDDVWLSPSYGRKTCWIGIIMYRPYGKPIPYKKYFKAYEDILRSFQGRPHWAKAHESSTADFDRMYPHWKDYCAIRDKLDPNGMFANAYVKRHILGHVGELSDMRLYKSKL